MYCFQVLTVQVFWYTSLDSYMAGTATYGLKPVVLGSLTYYFLASFHSRDRAPPAINSPATATRLIKRERLVYICVE